MFPVGRQEIITAYTSIVIHTPKVSALSGKDAVVGLGQTVSWFGLGCIQNVAPHALDPSMPKVIVRC